MRVLKHFAFKTLVDTAYSLASVLGGATALRTTQVLVALLLSTSSGCRGVAELIGTTSIQELQTGALVQDRTVHAVQPSRDLFG
jgi:hypothetical protein